jgi:hypothetical protein
MRRLINELYPGTFPPRQVSPDEQERLRRTGQGLARYRPWARGRIGSLERRVHSALILAEHAGLGPVTTGWIVREVYLGPHGRMARRGVPEPKLEHWMYKEIRRACETYAVRIARGIGRGSSIFWKLKEGDARYAEVIRKRKAAAYARRKRKAPANRLPGPDSRP